LVAEAKEKKRKRNPFNFAFPLVNGFHKRTTGELVQDTMQLFRRGVKKPNETAARTMALVGATSTMLYLPSALLVLYRSLSIRDGETSTYKRSIEEDMKGFTVTCYPIHKGGDQNYDIPTEVLNSYYEENSKKPKTLLLAKQHLVKRGLKVADSMVRDVTSMQARNSQILMKRAVISMLPDNKAEEEVALSRRDKGAADNGGPKRESKRARERRVRGEFWRTLNGVPEPAPVLETFKHVYHLDDNAPRKSTGTTTSASIGSSNPSKRRGASTASKGQIIDNSAKKNKKKGQKGKVALIVGASALIAAAAHHIWSNSGHSPTVQAASEIDPRQQAAYLQAQQQAYYDQLQAQEQQQHYYDQQQSRMDAAGPTNQPAKRQEKDEEVLLLKRQNLFIPTLDNAAPLLYKRTPPPTKKFYELQHEIHHHNVNPADVAHLNGPQVERVEMRNRNKGDSKTSRNGNGSQGQGNDAREEKWQGESGQEDRQLAKGKMSKTKIILSMLGGLGLGAYGSGWYNQHQQQAYATQQAAQAQPLLGSEEDQYANEGYLTQRDLPSVGRYMSKRDLSNVVEGEQELTPVVPEVVEKVSEAS